MTTTYREICGTARGLRAHQVSGEPPCGTCAHAEAMRLLALEAIPRRPSPAPPNARPPGLPPITTPQEAQINRHVLLEEYDALDADETTEQGQE